MSKRFTKLIAIFAAAMAVLQVSAQVKQEGKKPFLIAKVTIWTGNRTTESRPTQGFPYIIRKDTAQGKPIAVLHSNGEHPPKDAEEPGNG